MMAPVPGVPEQLMDGKTFVFNEFIAIVVPIDGDVASSVYFNAGVNGWSYKAQQGTDIVQANSYWGTVNDQFQSLSLLYETYTVLDVMVEIIPSFPSVAYIATTGIYATQTVGSTGNFLSAPALAAQQSADLLLPLGVCKRKLAFQYYLQQNTANPYLLTYDFNTSLRQSYPVPTNAPTLPIMSFVYEYLGLTVVSQAPVMLIKTTTRMHFRGRQVDFFTPFSRANRLLTTLGPAQTSDVDTKNGVESIPTGLSTVAVSPVTVSTDQRILEVKQLLAQLQCDSISKAR